MASVQFRTIGLSSSSCLFTPTPITKLQATIVPIGQVTWIQHTALHLMTPCKYHIRSCSQIRRWMPRRRRGEPYPLLYQAIGGRSRTHRQNYSGRTRKPNRKHLITPYEMEQYTMTFTIKSVWRLRYNIKGGGIRGGSPGGAAWLRGARA